MSAADFKCAQQVQHIAKVMPKPPNNQNRLLSLTTPDQPAVSHQGPRQGSAAAPKPSDMHFHTATAAAGPVVLQPLSSPAGNSAASSPGTPPAAEALPSATPPTLQQQQQQQQSPNPADAALAAATAAVGCGKHRLEGSLLLHQLLPLTASLGAALMASDLGRMHCVLTLLQSVPVTGHLLLASQIARPVRQILQQQQQVQMQMQHMQEDQQQLLQTVVATARQLLARWRALLSAEVSATDVAKRARARQLLRQQKLKAAAGRKQQQHVMGSSSAADHTLQHQTAQQAQPIKEQHPSDVPQHQQHLQHLQQPHDTTQPSKVAGGQHKRSYGGWLLQQHRQQQHLQGPDTAGLPPPSHKRHKQDQGNTLKPSQHQGQRQTPPAPGFGAAAAGAASTAETGPNHLQRGGGSGPAAGGDAGPTAYAAGSSLSPVGASLGRRSSGLFCRSNSSSFSLGAARGSSYGDLAALGLDWDAVVPAGGAGNMFGSEVAAAGGADAFLVPAGTGAGDDDEGQLVDLQPYSMQAQGQEAGVLELGRLMVA